MPARKSRTSGTKSTAHRSRTRRSSSARGKASGSASHRKYGPKVQEIVHTEMKHLQKGEHKNRKQAIAIGLSKARRAGAKVPPRKAA